MPALLFTLYALPCRGACRAAGCAPRLEQQRNQGRDVMLKIYHLERTRGERVIWACEEMGIPYELMMQPGEFQQAYAALNQANPIMHTSPTVIDEKGRMLMESGAILEWLRITYGKGQLAPPPEDSFEYFTYLKWLHFAEAT